MREPIVLLSAKEARAKARAVSFCSMLCSLLGKQLAQGRSMSEQLDSVSI